MIYGKRDKRLLINQFEIINFCINFPLPNVHFQAGLNYEQNQQKIKFSELGKS